MKYSITIFIFIISIQAFSQNNEEQTSKTYEVYESLKNELSQTLDSIRTDYSSRPDFVEQLTSAQKIWEEFRDSEIMLRFPKSDPHANYGSVHSQCVVNLLIELTRQRINNLKPWLEGIEEGDICTGSIKLR